MQQNVIELPRLSGHNPKGEPRPSRRSRWRFLSLLGVHILFVLHLAHLEVNGTSLGPLEPSEAGETLTLGYINAGFIFLAILIVLTLIFGRFFCGWACHLLAYQDGCAYLLKKLGLKVRPFRSRLLAWVPALAAIQMFVLPSVLRALGGEGMPDLVWHLQSEDLFARMPSASIAIATILVDGVLIIWFLGSKGFCTYGCPYGAIFAGAERVAPGRIRVNDDCEACGHCTDTCTSNVLVHEEVARFGMVVDPGCMKCMDCVDVCPKDALSFSFRTQSKRPRKRAARRPRRNWDLSWPEEFLGAALFVGAMYAYRGLYDLIPLLLSLGLASITALAGISLIRLIRRRGLAFQNWILKRDSKFTKGGFVAGTALVLYLGLGIHSAFFQYVHARGQAKLVTALEASGPARAQAAEQALAKLQQAFDMALHVSPDLRLQVSSAAFGAGQAERAQEFLRDGVEDGSRDPRLHLRLAEVRASMGLLGEAKDTLLRGLAHAPEDRDLRLALVKAEINAGRLPQAFEALQPLLEESPPRAPIGSMLEWLYAQLPNDNSVALAYAKALLSFDQHEPAQQVLERILARDPNCAEAQELLGAD